MASLLSQFSENSAAVVKTNVIVPGAINAILQKIQTCKCDVFNGGLIFGEGVSEALDLFSSKLNDSIAEIVGQYSGERHYNPKFFKDSQKKIEDFLATTDGYLLANTYLIGQRVTLADISLAYALIPFFQNLADAAFQKKYVNVTRWFTTIINLGAVKSVLGEITLTETAVEVKKPEPKKQEAKKEKAPQQQQPKKEKKVVEEKVEEEKVVEEKVVEEEEEKEDPNAPLDMDWWKRLYSNTKPANYPQMWPQIWAKLDQDGFQNWSIWFSDYLYPEEYKLQFQFSNLISGFIQRLDEIRKTAFGNILILGTDGNFKARAAWLFKGTELLEGMKECPDFPSWKFWKGDPSKPEDRKTFEEISEWEGKFGFTENVPFLDGKTFK